MFLLVIAKNTITAHLVTVNELGLKSGFSEYDHSLPVTVHMRAAAHQ